MTSDEAARELRCYHKLSDDADGENVIIAGTGEKMEILPEYRMTIRKLQTMGRTGSLCINWLKDNGYDVEFEGHSECMHATLLANSASCSSTDRTPL